MIDLLTITGLKAGHGAQDVLRGLDLASGSAKRLGLFGPNGHGKTTLLRTVSGLLMPRGGSIVFNGTEIAGAKPKSIVERGIVHVAQGSRLFPKMTVSECLDLGAFLPRSRPKARENLELIYSLFPKLAARRDQQCGTLSGGERQMVAIGIGLMSDPTLLILDEPTLGLAPKLKAELCGAIDTISQSGLPLIVVEQDIDFLLSVTDVLFLISHGVVDARMTSADRLSQTELMQKFFGDDQNG